MTPAERARQIDKEEFEAECAAIRQRAFARFGKRKPERDPRVQRCIDRGYEGSVSRFNAQHPVAPTPAPAPEPKKVAHSAIMHEAFGESKTLNQWANEYTINPGTIRTRLKMGWTLENALKVPVMHMGRRTHKKVMNESILMDRPIMAPDPGVVSDLQASKGTGGGSLPQAKNPEYNFSGIEA